MNNIALLSFITAAAVAGQTVWAPPPSGFRQPPSLTIFAQTQPSGGGPGGGGSTGTGTGGGGPTAPACTTTTPLTVSPMPVSQIPVIIPQGNINPTAHVMPTNHTYFGLPGLTPGVYPVVSPGAVTLTGVVVKQNTTVGTTNSYTEYSMTFQVCSGISINFDHLGSPSTKILAAIQAQYPLNPMACNSGVNGTVQSSACQVSVNVPLAAGDPVASSSGITPSVDFGAWDTGGTAIPFLQPNRYLDESNHNICPVGLFTSDIQAKLTPLFGQLVGTTLVPRTAAPVCGSINFDVAGTASGNWWATQLAPGSSGGDESSGVAFIADNVNPSVPVISMGNGVPGIQPGRYLPSSSAPAFASIKFTGSPQVTCFSGMGGAQYTDQILLVALTAADQLKIEGQRGTCSGQSAFTSAAVTMYR